MNSEARYFSASELAEFEIDRLPRSDRGMRDMARREKWPSREVRAQGGKRGMRVEYQPPPEVQRQIEEIEAKRPVVASDKVNPPAAPASVAAAAVRMPQEDLLSVPYYDVTRVPGVNAFIERGPPSESLVFSLSWFTHRIAENVSDIVFIRMPGKGMLPTLSEGDLLAVDLTAIVVTDGIYVLVLDNCLGVMRLQRRIGGKIRVISEDRSLLDGELPDLSEFPDPSRIIGRVIWADRKL